MFGPLLSQLPRNAGVFAGLDSEESESLATHPP